MAVITKTLKPSGGDYSAFSAWEAGEQADLVAAGDSHELVCDAGSYDGGTLDGWVTGSGNGITIKAATGHEHNGVPGAGVVFSNALNVYDNYVTVQDVEIYNSVVMSGAGTFRPQCLGFVGDRLIVRSEDQSASVGGLYSTGFVSTAQDSCKIQNSLIIGGYMSVRVTRGFSIRNCTVINTQYKATGNGPQQLFENNIYHEVAALSDLSSYNSYGHSNLIFTSDANITGVANSVTNEDEYSLFTDFDNGDYTLKAGSTAIGYGLDRSGHYSTDIAGESITNWDNGAWQYVAAGGTTAIYNDSTIQWSIIQAVQSDSTVKWSILNAIFNDTDLRWNLINAISADADLRWNLIEAIMQDSDLRWDVQGVLGTVQADASLQWRILNAIAQNLDARWGILNSAEQGADLRWNAFSAVTNDADFRWAVINAVEQDSNLQWEILTTAAQDIDLRWGILNAVAANADVRWSILEAILNSTDIRWDITAPAGTVISSLDIRWNVLVTVFNTLTSPWNILNQVTQDGDLRWNLLNAISSDSQLAWAITQAAQNDLDIRWSLKASTASAITLQWTIEGEDIFPEITGEITLTSKTPVFTIPQSLTPKITLH